MRSKQGHDVRLNEIGILAQDLLAFCLNDAKNYAPSSTTLPAKIRARNRPPFFTVWHDNSIVFSGIGDAPPEVKL